MMGGRMAEGGVVGRNVAVRFGTAADVLDSYWGFLSHGGLVLRDDHGLTEGEPVHLEVTIESSSTRVSLRGQVVRGPAAEPRRSVIAFDPGQPQDQLLTAAWSEVENVPARRHRRFPLEGAMRLLDGRGREILESKGKVVNLSAGGICLRTGAPLAIAQGARVTLGAEAGTSLPALVRWISGTEIGLEFAGSSTENEAFARSLR